MALSTTRSDEDGVDLAAGRQAARRVGTGAPASAPLPGAPLDSAEIGL